MVPWPDRSARRRWATLLLPLSGALAASAAGSPPPQTQWSVAGAFVDRARDIALELTRPPSAGEAEMMLVWLEAAARIDPSMAEAQLRQAELLELLHRPESAHAQLRTYCELAPDDLKRRLSFLAGEFEQRQTAEERLQFCRSELQRQALPKAIEGELRRWLAETLRGTGDRVEALRQAQLAVEAFPLDFAAADLLEELYPGPLPQSQRVRRMLLAVCAAPHDPSPMSHLARRLDHLSMHEQAWVWHRAAARLFGDQPPPGLQIDLAWSLRDGGDTQQAIATAQRVAEAQPNDLDARMALLQFAREAQRSDVADRELAVLHEMFARTNGPGTDADQARRDFRSAWFYLEVEPDAAKAVEFAARAMKAGPDDPRVKLVYGLALSAVGKHAEAKVVLQPLAAAGDQWASLGLGAVLRESSDSAGAVQALRAGERLRRSGLAYERITQALTSLGEEPLPVPDHSDVERVLTENQTDCLEFPFAPEKFLNLSIQCSEPAPAFGSVWVAEIDLRNAGTFPITIGTGQMIEGELLISANVTSPLPSFLGPVLRVPIDRVPVLEPGGRIQFSAVISRGALGKAARSWAQADLVVGLVATISVNGPARTSDQPSQPLLLRAETQIQRQAVRYEQSSFAELMEHIRHGEPAEQVAAYLAVAGLLAEAKSAPLPPSQHRPVKIDAPALTRLLAVGLRSESADVRVCTLQGLGWLRLTDDMIRTAAELLYDPDWRVRLAAVDLLASDQGKAFLPVVGRLSQADTDDLVRRLCSLHDQRLQSRMVGR